MSSRSRILRARRAATARRHLRIERLEDRRLLALTDFAAITGVVYRDATGDGFTSGEQVAGATLQLYRDANASGTLDAGDGTAVASATTDSAGRFTFNRLTAGNYFVEQPAQPAGGAELTRQVSTLLTIDSTKAQGVTGRTIDAFTTAQTVMAPFPVGTRANSSVTAPEALGGERDLVGLLSTGVSGDSLSMEVKSGSGRLTFNPSFGAAGTYTVVWDGPDGQGDVLNPIGLRTSGQGVDLTQGGTSTAFHLTIGVGDANSTATVRVYTDAANWSQTVIALSDTSGQPDRDYLVDMAQGFTTGAGAGATFTNVGAVALELVANATAMDGQMTVIATAGPGTVTANFDNLTTADLGLTKTVSTAAPAVGGAVTYTVTVSNAGPATATNVAVSDPLPSGLTFVSATPSQGTFNSATGVWMVGAVSKNATATLQLKATVTSSGTVSNTAQITAADQTDPNSANNLASATLTAQAADLSLTQTVSKTNPSVGETVTFTTTLNNAGPDTASGITVSAALPAGITFASASASAGAYSNGVWTVGTLGGGGTATLQLTGTVATAGTKTSTAQVTAAQPADPDSTPNNNNSAEDDQASVAITPPSADLALTQTVSNLRPNVRSNVVYTLTLSNKGPDGAANVAVRDALPSGLTFVSVTPSQGTYTAGTGVWTVGAVPAGGNATLKLTATVATAGAKVNTAEVSASSQPDPNSTPNNNSPSEDDQASVTVTPQAADLSLAKNTDTPTPNVNTKVTFTVTLTNSGPDTATNVAVTDLLPAGLRFVSATPSQGMYNSATGIWTVGSVTSGTAATLQVVATVTQQGAQANAAQVTASDQYDPDSTPNNNLSSEDDQATVGVTPQVADLSLTQTVDNNAPNVGQEVVLTLTLSNTGPAAATSVLVHDALPAGLALLSATPSTGAYDAGTAIWTVGSIASGGLATLQLNATVTAAGTKTNTAEVSASDQFDLDSTPNNNKAGEDDLATVTVNAQAADLALTQTVDNAAPNVGQTVKFTVKVTNAGPEGATNVAVHDALPDGLTFVSATASQGDYNSGSGTWTVGAIAKGANATLQLVATVQDAAPMTNTAEVSAVSQWDPNSTPNNNTSGENDQAAVTITPPIADLALTQAVDFAAPNVGQNVTLTTTVRNTGPAAASNVQVAAALPSGVTFVSVKPSQGQYDQTTGQWTVGAIAKGAAPTLKVVAKVNQLDVQARSAQITASDQFDPDSTPNNNVATEDDQATVALQPQSADLSLTQTLDNAAPDVGNPVTFTLTLNNAGPDAASNVTVNDVLPEGLMFASATPSQGTYTPGTGTWSVGTLTASANATLRLTATVISVGDKTNTAEVAKADQFDPDSTPGNQVADEDDQASAAVSPTAIDLSLTQDVDNTKPNVGQQVVFTLTLQNAGPDAATGVVISDGLPRGLTFVRATPSQGTYNAASGQWAVGGMAANAGAVLQIVATVAESGEKTHTAQVYKADQGDINSTPGNNNAKENDQASITIKPPVADLSLTQKLDNAAPQVNDNITVTVTVANAGPDDATGLTVTDALPASLTYVSATPSQGSYAAGSGLWTVGGLAAGTTATLKIVATATGPEIANNTAEVTTADQFDPDSTPANNVATEDDQATVEIVPQVVDLAIDKSGLPTTVIAGNSLTYTIVVTNTGRSTATGVLVTDTLPGRVTFNSVTASQGTASAENGVVTANLGELAPNGTATVTVVVDVAAGTTGSLKNEVTVAADQFDTNPENNRADVSTTARLPPARITGKVYLDMDNDGLQDPLEPPIAGVQLKLTGLDAEGNAIELIQIADQNGVFDFQDLNPGEYTLIETQPELFSSGKATAGADQLGRVVNNDRFFFQLGSNDHAQGYLFGEGFPFVTRRRYLASSATT